MNIIILICQKLGSVGPVQQKLSCLCLRQKKQFSHEKTCTTNC